MTATFDPYATLGIPAGSSLADAARAHRRLAKRFHPDINPGPAAAERMRRINEAWRLLSNPTSRAAYDLARRTASQRPSWTRPQYGPRIREQWAPWPDSRRTWSTARPRVRPTPVDPAFGDRPVVAFAVALLLGFLYFIGAWLGSVAR